MDRPIDPAASFKGIEGQRVMWRKANAVDSDGQIDLGRIYSLDDNRAAYGYAEVQSRSERKAQMAVGSDDSLTVWLNGKEVYRFDDQRLYGPEQARFEVPLRRGANRILIRCGNAGGDWKYSLALSAAADAEFLQAHPGSASSVERYQAAAQKGQGRPARGRQLFSDAKGLACIKCHTVGKEGGKVGPELSSVGAKYPRDELIASVLYPSAKISSGYEPTTFALADGRVVTGIVRNQDPAFVEIQDADAKVVRIARDDVAAEKLSGVSLMPSGLAQGLTLEDFADLIAYLESLK
jgi:putative heme-binding domain-containing protein